MTLRARTMFAALLLASPVLLRAQSFTVGTATASPGQRATGYLEVQAGVDAGMNIPVVVVNGVKPGKVLALVSGAHGTEYVSIIAIENSSRNSTQRRLRARSFSYLSSTFSLSNKKFRTSIPSTTKA